MSKIRKTDSVAELARFWDEHDVTDFENELEEVEEPVFVRENLDDHDVASGDRIAIKVVLPREDADALHRAAASRGVKDTEPVREWVKEKLQAG